MRRLVIGCVAALVLSAPGLCGDDGARQVKLQPTPWSISGQPVLGTYIAGENLLAALAHVNDAEMNLIFGDERELDTKTPEGAYCAEHGIKVLYHLTRHLYHGISLRDPVTPDQISIPLYFAQARPAQASFVVQFDDEIIRYDSIDDTGLLHCKRGSNGTRPAAHREGTIAFWPEPCAEEILRVKDSPNLFGYYVLDDSPGDAVSALRALYATIHKADPGKRHPVCAGFGDAGSVINFAPGICDIMFIYWYPVSTRSYDRERTSLEVQRMLTTARSRVPGIPFVGIYQAFDGRDAQTGQGVPTPEQLREQLEDFVREGASGLVAFWAGNEGLPGWTTLPELGDVVKGANHEIHETGGMLVRSETDSMRMKRIQAQGYWKRPRPFPGVVPAWNELGPFEDSQGKLLRAEFPPDAGIDANAVYPVKIGSAAWRVRETTCGVLGLTNIYGGQQVAKNCVDYLYCDVTSPKKQKVQLRVCTDDDGIIRLNGTEVYRFEGPRGLDYDKDIVPVTLPKGSSRIEAKIYNRAGMWGLFMRFTDLDGKPLRGLSFAPGGG